MKTCIYPNLVPELLEIRDDPAHLAFGANDNLTIAQQKISSLCTLLLHRCYNTLQTFKYEMLRGWPVNEIILLAMHLIL